MRTYADVAAAFNVKLCGGCDSFTPAQHQEGEARANTVHWTPRRLERRGLRRFLTKVAGIRVLNYNLYSKPMQIYMANAWTTSAAAALHIRFPRSYARNDRLLARGLVVRHGDELTPAAHRWVYRKDNDG